MTSKLKKSIAFLLSLTMIMTMMLNSSFVMPTVILQTTLVHSRMLQMHSKTIRKNIIHLMMTQKYLWKVGHLNLRTNNKKSCHEI